MSENYTIQELGGAELAQHYPDKGTIPESNWYNAVVRTHPQVDGLLSWLGSFKHVNSFMAILSANAEGLRIQVAVDEFVIFIPWTEAMVAAERGWPATIVRMRTAAVPSLTLEFNLDDDAADELIRKIIPALPRRQPTRRLALEWWIANLWVTWVVVVAGMGAGLFSWLLLGNK